MNFIRLSIITSILCLSISFVQAQTSAKWENFLTEIKDFEYENAILVLCITKAPDGKTKLYEITCGTKVLSVSINAEAEKLSETKMLAQLLNKIYDENSDFPKQIIHNETSTTFIFFN